MRASNLATFLLTSALFAGCASHDSPAGKEPEPDEPARLSATIASIELLEDCPDPEPAAEEQESAKQIRQPEDEDRQGVGLGSSCVQSTLQLSLSHDAAQSQHVQVAAVRLLRADTKQSLTTLRARKPAKWNGDGVYRPWDELVPVGDALKVSYRLAAPDWDVVQKQLADRNTFDTRYIVEVDLSMAGTITTLRSTEVARLQIDVVET